MAARRAGRAKIPYAAAVLAALAALLILPTSAGASTPWAANTGGAAPSSASPGGPQKWVNFTSRIAMSPPTRSGAAVVYDGADG